MTAIAVLQAYLDRIGTAVMSGDFETYRHGVTLPFTLITATANLRIETEAALRQGFDAYRAMLRSNRATDMIRLAENAIQLDDRLISGHYVTNLLSGGVRIVPPIQSQMTLVRDDGIWRATSISTALANARWPIDIPRVQSGGSADTVAT